MVYSKVAKLTKQLGGDFPHTDKAKDLKITFKDGFLLRCFEAQENQNLLRNTEAVLSFFYLGIWLVPVVQICSLAPVALTRARPRGTTQTYTHTHMHIQRLAHIIFVSDLTGP